VAEKRQEAGLKTFVLILEDGVKRMILDRIGEPRRSRLRRHDHHG